MKITVVQMDMKLGQPKENFAHAEELIRKAALENPDVIQLPETWNVGFFPREGLAEMADFEGKEVKERIGALAKELNVNIVAGSVANRREDGRINNTAYIFDRSGNCIAEYDKTHLFTPSGEHDFFTPGSHITTFELDGHRCGMIICYDIRFLELVRMNALAGIEVLFVSAQWPAIRRYHWKTLVAARSIENQMFVSACNSCAPDTKEGGCSRICDPWGEVLAEAGEGEEIFSAELDFGVIEGIRSSINVFRDRRPDFYTL